MNVIAKIISYLTLKEGFAAEIEDNSNNVTRVILVDSMGYRYELSVKLVGRNYIEPEATNRIS